MGEIVVALSIGNEIVESSKVVLPIDRQPAPFDAAVDGPHSVRRLVKGHTWRKRSGSKCQHSIGIVERCVLRVALIEICKTVFPGSAVAGPDSNDRFLVALKIVLHSDALFLFGVSGMCLHDRTRAFDLIVII